MATCGRRSRGCWGGPRRERLACAVVNQTSSAFRARQSRRPLVIGVAVRCTPSSPAELARRVRIQRDQAAAPRDTVPHFVEPAAPCPQSACGVHPLTTHRQKHPLLASARAECAIFESANCIATRRCTIQHTLSNPSLSLVWPHAWPGTLDSKQEVCGLESCTIV